MSNLAVSHLFQSFHHGVAVVKDVSFTLSSGTITLLAGPNGSGKSVLLKTIKGLLKPQSGTISLDKEVLAPKERMRRIALVFQDSATQVVGHTVEKDIRFGMDNLGVPEKEQERRIKETAGLLHLEGMLDRDPRTLSGGELKRVSIAGLLVMKPDILMLDEPFVALDWQGVREVLGTLLDLRKQGCTLLVVTHEVEKILAHVDRVLVMDGGTLVADGPADGAMSATLRAHEVYVPPMPVEAMTWLA